MSAAVNLALADIRVLSDANAHVALEFYRGSKWSEFLAFEGRGLRIQRMPTASFLKKYCRAATVPPGPVAVRFLGTVPGSYELDPSVVDVLLEIATMESTQGAGDLGRLDLKGLVAHYNGLAKAVGRSEVKNFKSKAEALKRIESVSAAARVPTEQQRANAETTKAKAAKASERLSKLSAERAAEAPENPQEITAEQTPTQPKEQQMAAKKQTSKAKPAKKAAAKKSTKTTKVAKAAEKQQKPTSAKRPGIGAFCREKIMAGLSNEEVVAAAKKQFPGCSTSASSVSWYRNQLREEGKV